MTMAGDGSHALLVLGFESTDHPVEAAMERALEICAEHGGTVSERRERPGGDAVSSWREAFLGAPYLRDVFVAMGVLSETFETAITWERFPGFHERVTAAAAEEAVREACGSGQVSCRFTHVYPDGPAVYFTVIAPARRGEEVERWTAIKRAVSDVRVSPRVARSPTTTPSGATTGRGMTSSDRRPSPRRCAARRRPSIHRAS